MNSIRDWRRAALGCWMSGLVAAAPAAALEPRIAAPLPGLASDPSGTVTARACEVILMDGHIRLRCSLDTPHDAPALLVEGTTLAANTVDGYPDRHFAELGIQIDGKPRVLEDRYEAFAGTRNVTALIKLAGMDPWAVERMPPVASAQPSNSQVVLALTHLHAIEKSDDDYLARWSVRRRIRISLEKVREQRLELDYDARPSVSAMTFEQLDTSSRQKAYCASPKLFERWAQPVSRSRSLDVVEYIVPTGVDDKPPDSVLLTVQSRADGGRVPTLWYVCGPQGRSIARKNAISREPVEADATGAVRLLRVSVSATPPSQETASTGTLNVAGASP